MLGFASGLLTSTVMAQTPVSRKSEPPTLPDPGKEELVAVSTKVDVNPVARDDEIRTRLQSVLNATGWFGDPKVDVDEGVVFLTGRVKTDELKKWAGDLARNTQDVVAVVNRMELPETSAWDLKPAWSGLGTLWREFIRAIPFLVFGLLILALSVGAAMLSRRSARALLRTRIRAKLLRNVVSSAIGILVFLFGTYIVLRVSGLTQLALTVVGGTGLIGLALGIAFRDISENFLASIFLSMQRPFETGDLIEVSGITGYVQQLNVRTTILMTLEGNLVQVPNATIYKSNLLNFTTNANRRDDFVVGIGYDDSISDAQESARRVLADHPAVLNDPEPWVLVDSMGKSTINLRIYFWLNGREHSWLKVRSSVIRLVKRALQQQGISMPDEARGVIFPQGVPVTVIDRKPGEKLAALTEKETPADSATADTDAVSTRAEAGLSSESSTIEEQARQAKLLNGGENLLNTATGGGSTSESAKSRVSLIGTGK